MRKYLKMNYKETLFFIGKCLTISHEKENLKIVSNQIISKNVNWDSVVKVSTAHYVFPALYCNLKRANLLSFLPVDLVSFMKHITDLNRERNLQIIEQAKEINTLLLENGITPIFLKGTGFLLQNFYEDPAERMVGDIDFLVSENDYELVIKLLKNDQYFFTTELNYHRPTSKHYPRIQKDNKIAAVEIHYAMTIKQYNNEFNYNYVHKDLLNIENITVLNYSNQLVLTIIATQINDNNQFFKNISLRNAYDVYLLTIKTDSLESIIKFDQLFSPLNKFLGLCNEVLSSNIHYKKMLETEKYKATFYRLITNEKFQKQHSRKWKRKLFLRSRLSLIYKSMYKKENLYWFIRRVTDKTWYKEKMIQLGIKSNS